MAQRIFDTDNKKDMADLWDILPESCKKITVGNMWDSVWENSEKFSYKSLFKINWHDKTEITRPIQEATEQDIGKLCVFWSIASVYIGKLCHIKDTDTGKYYEMSAPVEGNLTFLHCRRLTKQEIEELC